MLGRACPVGEKQRQQGVTGQAGMALVVDVLFNPRKALRVGTRHVGRPLPGYGLCIDCQDRIAALMLDSCRCLVSTMCSMLQHATHGSVQVQDWGR